MPDLTALALTRFALLGQQQTSDLSLSLPSLALCVVLTAG